MKRSRSAFDYSGKRRKLTELEERSRADEFWSEAETAQRVMKELSGLRDEIEQIDGAERLLHDAREMLEVLGGEAGADEEIDANIARAQANIDALEMAANFDGEYDSHGAIVTIHAGAGGTDAADWVAMLARMYIRWAEGKGFRAEIAEESPGDEAGLKSITFFIRGKNAYGLLESERGVHRLVRLSPFDAAHRRHTSFASVDIIPEIEAAEKIDLEIKPDDLRIETFKSGGAGGQYVN